jgi:regulator of cell morphogenesis and NO signaling
LHILQLLFRKVVLLWFQNFIMELFDQHTKMTDLVHGNYLLLPVLNRFGIRLGFQDKTISDICQDNGIDLSFFLAIINAFHNDEYFPKDELQSFSSSLIVDYLRKSHLDFKRSSLPQIEASLNRLVKNSKSNDLKMIQSFYIKYKRELLEHINDEEENAFPYVLELQKAYDLKTFPLPKSIVNYSIQSYEKEHTNVDEKLFDLKNIIIKYLEPNYKDKDCNEFLFELFQFERDLTDHARIEDKILVPKVMEIEKELKNA